MKVLNKKKVISCPCCKSNNIKYLGQMPKLHIPSGKSKTIIFQSFFYCCNTCSLYFRHPLPKKEILDFLYQNEETTYQDGWREDWKIIREWLSTHNDFQKTIIDVGCFDGNFLAYLGGRWERFGVEINEAAAEKAKEKGVAIICKDFNQLNDITQKFGVVLATDVIEHTENPSDFLLNLVKITSPGGIIIISSGDPLSFSWKLMGRNYWYCLPPGHISFISEKWYRKISKTFNISIVYRKNFSRGDRESFSKFFLDCLKNIFYRCAPEIFARLRAIGFGGIDAKRHPELKYYPPNWRSAKDHLLIIFKKNVNNKLIND